MTARISALGTASIKSEIVLRSKRDFRESIKLAQIDGLNRAVLSPTHAVLRVTSLLLRDLPIIELEIARHADLVHRSVPVVRIGEMQVASNVSIWSIDSDQFALVCLAACEAGIPEEIVALGRASTKPLWHTVLRGFADGTMAVNLDVSNPITRVIEKRLQVSMTSDEALSMLLPNDPETIKKPGWQLTRAAAPMIESGGLRGILTVSHLDITGLFNAAGLGIEDHYHKNCGEILYNTAVRLELRLDRLIAFVNRQDVKYKEFVPRFGRSLKYVLGKDTLALCADGFISILLYAYEMSQTRDNDRLDTMEQGIVSSGWSADVGKNVRSAVSHAMNTEA